MDNHLTRLDHMIADRRGKLEALRAQGVDPFPPTTKRTHTIAQASTVGEGTEVAVAGRLQSVREHGKTVFGDLTDESGTIQVVWKADELSEDQFSFVKLLDPGDILSASGSIFTTKTGQLSVLVKEQQILAKALRPIPRSWQEFENKEERYRKRYLDLLANPEVRQLFTMRQAIIRQTRRFMDDHAFTEVETPTLQPIYGGASARPFTTHYNAYDTDVYLKIAPELYLKRLLIGGYERVYELSRNFRNEGADATHNPEFLELEFYAAYWDDEQLMDYVEDLVIAVVSAVRGKPEIVIEGKTIALAKPFARTTFNDLTNGDLSDQSFKVGVKKVLEPTFVRFTPRYLVPLAKAHDEQFAQSFQFVMGGVELAKAFAELNDPIDQRHQFELQSKGRAEGDEEAQPLDEDFLEALEYGMPPAAGFGMGMERFISMVAGQDSLRQTMYFPFMKPTGDRKQQEGTNA